MWEHEIQRCTRRCATSNRELAPGETFYSVLVEDGTEIRRVDVASDCWGGPPEGAVGWWKSTMPHPDARRVHWAPSDVMLDYFQRLAGQPGREPLRYLLALLMTRRRLLRAEGKEVDEHGRPILRLYSPRDETEYTVVEQIPSAAQIPQLQQELSEMLFAS